MLLASSSFFSSSSRRAWLFAELARHEASFVASLEPPSLDDSSAFLLVLLSDAFLHQHKTEALGKAPTRKMQAENYIKIHETHSPL